MIYTLTLNPSIDYVVSVSDFSCGNVNRGSALRFTAAGKGINVSAALKRMGKDSAAICLCGSGFIGEEFSRLLKAQKIESIVIPVENCDTRINVKICHDDSTTEVNGNFSVDGAAVSAVYAQLGRLTGGDILVIGGSLPNGFSADFYAKIVESLAAKGVTVIADISGEPLRKLRETIENNPNKPNQPNKPNLIGLPFLIKPNQHELGELFGVEINTIEDAVFYGGKIGCNVLVSMGGLGAVLVTASETVFVCNAPKVLKGYTVGAGDVLLAGFIAEYADSSDYEKALISGVNYASEYIGGCL